MKHILSLLELESDNDVSIVAMNTETELCRIYFEDGLSEERLDSFANKLKNSQYNVKRFNQRMISVHLPIHNQS